MNSPKLFSTVVLVLAIWSLPPKTNGQDSVTEPQHVSDRSFWAFQFNIRKLKDYDSLSSLESKLVEIEKIFEGALPVSSLKKITIQVAGEKFEKAEQCHATSFVFGQKLNQQAILESAKETGEVYVKKTRKGKTYWESSGQPVPILMFFGDNVMTFATKEMVEPLTDITAEPGKLTKLLREARSESDVVFAFKSGSVSNEIYDFLAVVYDWGEAKKLSNPFLTMKEVQEGFAEIDFSSNEPLRFQVMASSEQNAKKIGDVYHESIQLWKEFFANQSAKYEADLKTESDARKKVSLQQQVDMYKTGSRFVGSPTISVKGKKVEVAFEVPSGAPELVEWIRDQFFPSLKTDDDVVTPPELLE